jgi:hypothetical protein
MSALPLKDLKALHNDLKVFNALVEKKPEANDRYSSFTTNVNNANSVLILPCLEETSSLAVLKGLDDCVDISNPRWKLHIFGEKITRIFAYRCKGCREKTSVVTPCSFIRPTLLDIANGTNQIIVKISTGARFQDLERPHVGRKMGYIARLKAFHTCVICRRIMIPCPYGAASPRNQSPPKSRTKEDGKKNEEGSGSPEKQQIKTGPGSGIDLDKIPKRCSQKCGLMPYCGTACALAHWEVHKTYCGMLATVLEADYDIPHGLQWSDGVGWVHVTIVKREKTKSGKVSANISLVNSPTSNANTGSPKSSGGFQRPKSLNLQLSLPISSISSINSAPQLTSSKSGTSEPSIASKAPTKMLPSYKTADNKATAKKLALSPSKKTISPSKTPSTKTPAKSPRSKNDNILESYKNDEKSIIKIQSLQRGRQARKAVDRLKSQLDPVTSEPTPSSVQVENPKATLGEKPVLERAAEPKVAESRKKGWFNKEKG